MKVSFLIIGGGLSGLAAAIRFARYSPDVLLVEKHNKVGGLNSYYYRNKILLETGLHAITNYATPEQKKAPLNRLFRQLKLNRKEFQVYPQFQSEINFSNKHVLTFSNDFNVLLEDINTKFPSARRGFVRLLEDIDTIDPFTPTPFRSAKKYLFSYLGDELLCDMLLCPLMYYGSSVENDIDLNQFVIMFRSIYQEGMFRPAGSIKSFLDTLTAHYSELGGKIKLKSHVSEILHNKGEIFGVRLCSGEIIECDYLLSTIGHTETLQLLGQQDSSIGERRLGFIESIFLLEKQQAKYLSTGKTIIFYNQREKFNYRLPDALADFDSGVICFPFNFQGRPQADYIELRSTHLANFNGWKKLEMDKKLYSRTKETVASSSIAVLEEFIGKFNQHVLYSDTFTPLTINKYTSKKEGAIYGSPHKIKDGKIGFSNLFLAGTDQGFLGIVGSMLSGVSMVNQHVLPKI